MPRLFTAIELPEDIRDRLAQLRAPLPGARWVQPQDMHITLRFAGDVDNLVASEFAGALAGIDVEAFSVRVAGLGTFGSKSPKVIWAGVEANPRLDELARANERAARNAGLAPERRAFTPHITLAWLQHAKAENVARFLERGGAFSAGPVAIESFVLYSARPQTGGPPYVAEEYFPLRGSHPAAMDTSSSW